MIRDLETEKQIKQLWKTLLTIDDPEIRELFLHAHRVALANYCEWRREKTQLLTENKHAFTQTNYCEVE